MLLTELVNMIVEETTMKRVEPCEICANMPGCTLEFGGKMEFAGTRCHYYPAWGSPAFDRIRDQAREAGKDQRRE